VPRNPGLDDIAPLGQIEPHMKSSLAHPKKSPSSPARRKSPVGPRCRVAQTSRSSRSGERNGAAQQRRPTTLRRKFRAWRASLPTALERDTLLMPDVIAENVVREVELFLGEEFPARYAVWLATKAELCYSARRHYYRTLRRSGNAAREWLCVYMRHWLDSLLGLERPDLHHCLPREFGNGQQLPPGLHPRINRRGLVPDLLPQPRAWDAARVTRHHRWAWLLRAAA